MRKAQFLFTAILIFFCSCEKDNIKSHPANVHGSWMGLWSTDDNTMQGTFLAPANQSDDQIKGEIFVRIYQPDEVGYSPEYSGKVDAEEVRVSMKIEGLEIRATANLNNNTETSGYFEVGSDITGTFSGKKFPMSISSTEEIFKIEQTDNWYGSFFIAHDNFWISNIETGMFELIDNEGKMIEKRTDTLIENRPAYCDGTNFWVYGQDYYNPNNAVYQITPDGEILDSIVLNQNNVSNICYDNNTLYYSVFSSNTIYAVNHHGEILDSTKFEYVYLNNFVVHKDGFLLQTYSPYLIHISKQGEFINLYQVENTIYGVAKDSNDGIYCFTDELHTGENGVTETYRIIKTDL